MFTNNQLNILAILAGNPDKEVHMHELGRVLGKKPGVFQRGLNSLEDQEYVSSRRQGNQRLLSINTKHTLYREITRMVEKTHGAEALLRALVESLSGVHLALIYGSYASNRMRTDSDIDLMIVRTNKKVENQLLDKLPEMEQRLLREVNYKLYDLVEYRKKRRSDPFLRRVLGAKYVLLKGTP